VDNFAETAAPIGMPFGGSTHTGERLNMLNSHAKFNIILFCTSPKKRMFSHTAFWRHSLFPSYFEMLCFHCSQWLNALGCKGMPLPHLQLFPEGAILKNTMSFLPPSCTLGIIIDSVCTCINGKIHLFILFILK